jgi:H+/Cl- antiporter ClcA/CBS domain-containing protein
VARPPFPKRLLFLTVIAVGLGVAGGLAAWLLLHLIGLLTGLFLFQEWTWQPPTMADLDIGVALIPIAVAGGLVVSLLARWAPLIRGHGIPEAMEAVLTKQSRIAPRTALAKPISAAVAIGTGAPFGAEGPIIVTGSSIGSLLGQVLHVSASERKILLASGAAAGMAAVFGAPLAAVVLAVELLLFEFSARSFIPLVVATSVAGGMHALLYGAGPIFTVPPHDYAGIGALPLFLLLGLASGLLAVVISKGLYAVEDLYRRLPLSIHWHPLIGGAIFAVIGLMVPRTLGVGYDVINDLLASKIAVGTAAVLLVAKVVSWWFALGSGSSGGVLAPILLMASAFGVVVGTGLEHLAPGLGISAGAYAVVAMAATFGSATRAPFTAIVFVFELTQDYAVILPLMLATVVADLVGRSLMRDSILTEKLTRRGLRVGRDYVVDPFRTITAAEIMTTEVETLPSTTTVGEAFARFAEGRHTAFPLMEGGRCVAVLNRVDLLFGDAPDSDLATTHAGPVVAVAPADLAVSVLECMLEEQVDHVLVLDGDDVQGICTRTDLLRVRERQFAQERRQPGLAAAIGRLRTGEA